MAPTTKNNKEIIATTILQMGQTFTALVELVCDDILGETPTKPRKAKVPKDPNAPKRNLSSYMLYFQSAREAEARRNPTLKATELAKLMGEKWRAMSDKEKQPFVKRAVKEKMRFERETKDYQRKEASVADVKVEEDAEDAAPAENLRTEKGIKRKAEKKKTPESKKKARK